jgi:hypothetical protein
MSETPKLKLRYKLQDSGVRLELPNGQVLELKPDQTFEIEEPVGHTLLRQFGGKNPQGQDTVVPDPRFEGVA